MKAIKRSGCIAERGIEGFSLVEVSLAVMLVGLGVVTLFSLFPAGLRQSDNAVTDTRVGLFAESVFNGFRANAFGLTNAVDWADTGVFRDKTLGANLPVDGVAIYGDGASREVGEITYWLTVSPVSSCPQLYGANLKARWKDRDVQWFYTEVFYQGGIRP